MPRQRYQMTLMSEDQKTNTYGISIKPKLKEDKESFSLAFVNLDRKYLLPTRIIMMSPDGKSKKDFRLESRSMPNKAVNPQEFRGQAARPSLEDRPQPRRRGPPRRRAARARGARATRRARPQRPTTPAPNRPHAKDAAGRSTSRPPATRRRRSGRAATCAV